MDKTTVEYIGDQARKAAGENRIELPAPDELLVLRSDEQIHDLERYAITRRRFRSTVTTELVPELGSYVRRRMAERTPDPNATVGFVDLRAMAARIVFNMGDMEAPGHGDDAAVLDVQPTPDYQSLLTMLASPKQSQKAFAEWLEENRALILCFDENYLTPTESDGVPAQPLPPSKVVGSVRGLKIEAKRETGHQEKNFGMARTEMEMIDARGQGEALPAFIEYFCEPYPGFAARTFVLRTGIITSDPPVFTVRLLHKAKHDEAMAKELRDLVAAELGDEVALTIGTFKQGA